MSEDAHTQRRRLAAVWVAAGSALAAMVAANWYILVRSGGRSLGGDMVGHAAAARWLRTLPWWDWRGWSDWFYGGQAMGVNYPPLSLAWIRFVDPVHGQLIGVAVGLLVLLPWGAWRLARAVDCSPRAARGAVGLAMVLAAASGSMHWVLPGFHQTFTGFGGWAAMLALTLGLFCAAWAARCRRPVACGVVAGLSVLLNATVVPGTAVVCAALLVSSGAPARQAARWAATAAAAALAVSAWWLVPFVAGWERLVDWEVSLSSSWRYGDTWGVAVLAVLGVVTIWVARGGSRASRRLALAAGAGLLATLAGELFGYLRAERWLALSLLVAAVAAAGVFEGAAAGGPRRPARPAWALLGLAFLVVFVVLTLRLEALPLALWLLWWPRRVWAACGALAWACVLILVPLWGMFRNPVPDEPPPTAPLEAAVAEAGPDASGLVDLDRFHTSESGAIQGCAWGHPWDVTAAGGGRLRPLSGLYRETSPVAEFLEAETDLLGGQFHERGGTRPHWFEVWQEAGEPSLDTPAAAEALGARWFAACDDDGDAYVTALQVTAAVGAPVLPLPTEEAWHRAAVGWWMLVAAGGDATAYGGAPPGDLAPVPVLRPGEGATHPDGRAATGVTLRPGRDRLTVTAETPGWAWLRVPWDPYWRSIAGTPVHKGGPGHLVAWVEAGETELRWAVPRNVDVAAAATTGAAALAVAGLALVNRRRGWEVDADRRRPAAEALEVFAGTVDRWAYQWTAGLRGIVGRARQSRGGG